MIASAKTRPADVAGRHHGVEPPRGLEDVPHSSLRQGFFGRMFRTLPPLEADDLDLLELACSMFEDEGLDEEDDDFNNSDIPAGYTYLGQFIDHDVTFDPVSRLQRRNDPDALTNFRTPRLDLDSVYGGGPQDAPYLYQPDGVRLRLVERNVDGKTAWELPREADDGTGRPLRALIGDPRNDENTIVSQLHLAFIRFHNAVVDACDPSTPNLFDACQQIVRWHYQWLIVNDFLPKIVGQIVVDDVLGREEYDTPTSRDKDGNSLRGAKQEKAVIFDPNLRFFTWENMPFMPVEFAVAAYRFGHSMVRADYALNPETDGKNPDGTSKEIPIFSDVKGKQTLAGFRERPGELTIDWSFFFPIGDSAESEPQPSRNIDTRVTFNLSLIPGGPVQETDPALALPLQLTVEAALAAARASRGKGLRSLTNVEKFKGKTRSIGNLLPVRNLARGAALGLPCGQDVARAMGVPSQLILGPDNFANLDDSLKKAFAATTPLWYYILKEAEVLNDGKCLGPVGGRIVAEVLIGLIWGDRLSYLRSSPGWQPKPGEFGAVDGGNGKPTFGMPELLTFLNQPQSDSLRADSLVARAGNQGALALMVRPDSQGEENGVAQITVEMGDQYHDNLVEFGVSALWDNIVNLNEPLRRDRYLFIELRRVSYDGLDNLDHSIRARENPPLRRRGTIVFYVVSVPDGPALTVSHKQGVDDAGDPVEGTVKIYRDSVPLDVNVGEMSDPLRPGDTILVSEANYTIKCNDHAGAVLLMAGIDQGKGGCAGRPC